MPKSNNIKWRIEDEQELRRVVRNFNDKLRRLIKENPANKNVLPQFYNENTEQFESRITIEGLKSMIQTRQDFNRYLNMLKRFSKRGAEKIIDAPGNEYGTKTTVWERNELTRLAGIVNRKRQEKLEKLNAVEMVDATGKLGYTLGQRFGMGLASKNRLLPTRAFTNFQSRSDIKYKQRALLKEARSNYYLDRDKLLKENYIKTLEQNYRTDDIKDVISSIRNMDPNLFVLKFQAKGDAFEFAYPPDDETYNAYLSELKGFWTGNTNFLDIAGPGGTMALLDEIDNM